MTKDEKYKYKQIENYIYDGIRNSQFAVDSLLPTQEELCRQFDVSRTTVNRALNELVDCGIVEKIQGSGCYIRTPKLSKQVNSGYLCHRSVRNMLEWDTKLQLNCYFTR